MTTSRVLFSLFATALGLMTFDPVALPSAKAAPRTVEPRAVIELFTSQGCSSCPAADKLMSEFAHSDPQFIPLSLAIDYWDYLGWKDTLALPGHTKRQRAYSQMRGDHEIYTPQAVINGVAQAIGSDRAQIEQAVERSYSSGGASPLSVPVRVTVTDQQVSVTIPAHDNAAESEIWLCPVSGQVSVGIGRGENRGRTLTYTNVVRRWIKLGNWDGQRETFTVPLDAIKDYDNVDLVAVILQNGSAQQPGPIVGASLTSLNLNDGIATTPR